MSKMEYGNAVKSFMAMDLDGDGYLSIEEFRSSLGLLGIDDSFAQILFNSFAKAEHHDRDGFINRSEFCASMAVMLHPTRVEEQVSMAFDAYDLNHDGKLSLEELESVITAMFAAMVKMRIRRPDEHPTAALAAVDLFRHMDAEDKGYVTKEDYLRLATTNPELLKKLDLRINFALDLDKSEQLPTPFGSFDKPNLVLRFDGISSSGWLRRSIFVLF